MTKPIAGTKTEQKLLQSYFAESAAYTRYTFYALKAAKENIFLLSGFSMKQLPTNCVMPRCFSNSFRAVRPCRST